MSDGSRFAGLRAAAMSRSGPRGTFLGSGGGASGSPDGDVSVHSPDVVHGRPTSGSPPVMEGNSFGFSSSLRGGYEDRQLFSVEGGAGDSPADSSRRVSDESGSPLVVVSADMCGGFIGRARTKFCTRTDSSLHGPCMIQSHKVKAPLAEGHGFIQCGDQSAYVSPSVNLPGLSQEIRHQVLDLSLDKQAWLGMIASLSSVPDQSIDHMLGTATAVKRPIVYVPKTPAVTKKAKFARGESPHGSPKLGEVPMWSQEESDDDPTMFLVGNWNSTASLLNTLRVRVATLEEQCGELLPDDPFLEDKLSQLGNTVGSLPTQGYSPPGATLWDSIRGVDEKAEDLEQAILKATEAIKSSQTVASRTQGKLNRFEKEFSELVDACEGPWKRSFELTSELTGDGILAGPAQQLYARLDEAFQQHQGKFGHPVGEGVAGSQARIPGKVESMVENSLGMADVKAEMKELAKRVEESETTIRDLQATNSLLLERVNSQGIAFGDSFFLGSLAEAQSWVTHHVPNLERRFFYDIVSFMTPVQNLNRNESDVLDEEFKSKRADLDKLTASFSIVFPACFGIKGTPGESNLPALPNHEAWDSPGRQEGLLHRLRSHSSRFRSSTLQSIRATFQGKGGAKARDLAEEMVRQTIEFFDDMAQFVDQFYRELIDVDSVSSKDAWDLVAHIIREIFKKLGTLRSVGVDAKDAGLSKAARCSMVLWGALSAHQYMKSLRSCEFRGHPDLAPAILLHVVQKKASCQRVEAVSQQMTSLKKELMSCRGVADQALSAATKTKK